LSAVTNDPARLVGQIHNSQSIGGLLSFVGFADLCSKAISASHRNPKKGGWDRRTLRTGVLGGEELFQLTSQDGGAPVLFRSVVGIHGRTIIGREVINKRRRWAIEAENERIPVKRDLIRRDSGAAKPLYDVVLYTPGHRADKAFRRRRRIGRADLQNLRYQRRVIGNPVSHHHPPS